jgi:hypothetical protein
MDTEKIREWLNNFGKPFYRWQETEKLLQIAKLGVEALEYLATPKIIFAESERRRDQINCLVLFAERTLNEISKVIGKE